MDEGHGVVARAVDGRREDLVVRAPACVCVRMLCVERVQHGTGLYTHTLWSRGTRVIQHTYIHVYHLPEVNLRDMYYAYIYTRR